MPRFKDRNINANLATSCRAEHGLSQTRCKFNPLVFGWLEDS